MRASIQIKNNKDWELNSKSYFDFENIKDLNVFCYRLSSIHQKEVRSKVRSEVSATYYSPYNSDNYLERVIEN